MALGLIGIHDSLANIKQVQPIVPLKVKQHQNCQLLNSITIVFSFAE